MGSTPPPHGHNPAQVPSAAPGAPAHISKAGSTPAMPASGTSATAAPNVASVNHSEDELVRLACEKISESIFHVKFETRDKSFLRAHIEKLINKLPAAKVDIWRSKMEEILNSTAEMTTGFVVGDEQDYLLVLTCAHAFQACFNASNPVSVTALRKMFKISVRCDHEELNYDKKASRVYTEADVFKVDTRKDMLLLRVKKQCTHSHEVLEMAENLPPSRLGLVGMVSWPFDRHRTTVKGCISHNVRGQEDVNDVNDHGYNFSAIEVNITSEAGSSGAPMVDTAAKVLGLLHGGDIDCVTYFVSLDEITARLTSWGIIKKVGSRAGSSSSSSSRKRNAGTL